MDRKGGKGFSLLELMVVLAVMAVLATLALPSYSLALQQGRRADAMEALLRVQLAQEQWRARHVQYASLTQLGLGNHSRDGHYRIEITAQDVARYHATATPRADGPQAGDACGIFAVHQDGSDHSAGYADARCWKR
jgi:type IV pilus assembly protein PilE